MVTMTLDRKPAARRPQPTAEAPALAPVAARVAVPALAVISAPPPITDPDLVDRIFDYVVELLPELAGRHAEVKAAVREESAGQGVYIQQRSKSKRQQLAVQIFTLFNGRNATEVARTLQISRATVYRVLKQPGNNA